MLQPLHAGRTVFARGGGLLWRRGILDGPGSRWYHADWLGSVKILSDINRNVTDTHNYDAFGDITNDTDPTPNPMRYVGQLGYYRHGGPATPRPPEYSGRNAFANCYGGRECLMLLGARWYDPVIGRFITQDPIGYAGGLNLYAYANNSPVGLADPSGLDFTKLSRDEERWIRQVLPDIEAVYPSKAAQLRRLLRQGSIGTDPEICPDRGEYYRGRISLCPDSVYPTFSNVKDRPNRAKKIPAVQQALLEERFGTAATLVHELEHSHQSFMARYWLKKRTEDAAYRAARRFLRARLAREKDPLLRKAIQATLDSYPKDYADAVERARK